MSYQLPGEKKIIEKWDKIPGNITFVLREGDEVGDDGGCAIGGCWVKKTSADLFANKKVVIFGLPGAFTPTCSSQQLPTYEKMYDEFKAQGVDEIYCLSVNDAFVMNAWAKSQDIQHVKVIPDGSGNMTRFLGMLIGKNHLGFGLRSWRFMCIVNDGVVEQWWQEPGINNEGADDDPYEQSTPKNCLDYLKGNQ